jgi:hypothetical protein
VVSTVSTVSLNRSEQLLFDYIGKHPEERQYWLHKVQAVAKATSGRHSAAEKLDAELWAYFRERAGVAREFKEFANVQGLTRTSMRNLSEHLIRLWAPQILKPAKQARSQTPPDGPMEFDPYSR